MSTNDHNLRSVNRPTGKRHQMMLKRRSGYVLEMEDAHFHFDSAVLMPDLGYSASNTIHHDDEYTTGLGVLAACFKHVSDNPTHKLLIAGHTDTSGPESYNLKLSRLRAENVLCALEGNRDGWRTIANDKHQVEDYQQILTWIAETWFWNCNPGPVDNKYGDRTKEGLKLFQQQYNHQFFAELKEDGKIGRQTWGAVFDVYMDMLRSLIGIDREGLVQLRQQLNFLDVEQKTVGCGENHPIEAPRWDHYRSHTNRRVELLFFEPGEEPTLTCHGSKTECNADKCQIYDSKIYHFQHLPCFPYHPELLHHQVYLLDVDGERIANAQWRARNGEDILTVDVADDQGLATLPGGNLPEVIELDWDFPDADVHEPENYLYTGEYFVFLRENDKREACRRMLSNLAYDIHGRDRDNVEDFQIDIGSPAITGAHKDIESHLRSWHGSGERPSFVEKDSDLESGSESEEEDFHDEDEEEGVEEKE